MESKPDFTQKLLDDIRRRKEKLGYTSNSTSSSSRSQQRSAQAASAELYRNSKRSLQPAEATRKKSINKKQINPELTFSADTVGVSQDVDPLKRGERLPNYVDVSMALALALSKSGKLQNMDISGNVTFGNELILRQGPLYLRRKNSISMSHRINNQRDQYPFLNNMHISEISNGLQNLNRIIEACPNMTNFRRDSYEIGRKLLKGAIDLEESLRMLITIQDASDYMIGSQSKQVRLLKGKEADNVQDMIVNKPRFASYKSSTRFDKLAKENYDGSRQGHKEVGSWQPKWLRYTKNETLSTHSISEYQSSSSNSSMGKIQQVGSQGKHPYSVELGICVHEEHNFSGLENIKQLNSEHSLPSEKLRMPNVIARLMGLEDFPRPDEKMNKVQKDQKERTIVQSSSVNRAKKEVTYKKFNFIKMIGARKFLQQKNTERKPTNNFEVVYRNRKKNLIGFHDFDDISPPKDASKDRERMYKKIEHTNIHGIVKDEKFMKQSVQTKNQREIGEQKNQRNEKINTREVRKSIQASVQQKTKQNQETEVRKKGVFLLEQKKEEQWLNLKNDRPKNTIILSQQPGILQEVTAKCSTHESAKEREAVAKGMPKSVRTTTSNLKTKKTEKSSQRVRINNVLSADANNAVGKAESIELPKEEIYGSNQAYQNRNKISKYMGDRTPASKISTYTGNKGPASESSRRNNPSKKEHGTDDKGKLGIDNKGPIQVLTLDGSKQVLDMDIINTVRTADSNELFKELDSFRNSKTPYAEEHQAWHLLDKVAPFDETSSTQPNDCNIIPENSFMGTKGVNEDIEDKLSSEETSGIGNIRAPDPLQKQEVLMGAAPELQRINPKEKPKGQRASRQCENYSYISCQNEASAEVKEQGSLTMNQYLLQQLNHMQQFLDAAQEISKIDIQTGVLQASKSPRLTDQNKLYLDIGIEILQRKSKRGEVTYSMAKYYAHNEVNSLDALIKELNNDLESLDIPSKPAGNSNDGIAGLNMIIEREIHNKYPDINCMWDFGWSGTTFSAVEKDEVVTEMANYVMDDLFCELARDLLTVSTSIF